MRIPESKVHLQEKDIEDYLFAHPEVIETYGDPVRAWVKRQFEIPSGVLDLLGVTLGGDFLIVEIKNTPIESAALTQVCRYAFDVENILRISVPDLIGVYDRPPRVYTLVIGRSIDAKTMREAEALNIVAVSFAVELSLKITGPYRWAESFEEDRRQRYSALSVDLDLTAAVRAGDQRVEEYSDVILGGGDEEEDCVIGKAVQR